jgi:hypothetical protein
VPEHVACRGAVQEDVIQRSLDIGGHVNLADFACAEVAEGANSEVGRLGCSICSCLNVFITVWAVVCSVAWMSVVTAGLVGVWSAIAIAWVSPLDVQCRIVWGCLVSAAVRFRLEFGGYSVDGEFCWLHVK